MVEFNMSFIDKENEKIYAAWMKKWNINQNTSELTCMSEFILAKKDEGESLKRNFIIYLVNCFFSKSKNHHYNKFDLKYVKDVNWIPSLG